MVLQRLDRLNFWRLSAVLLGLGLVSGATVYVLIWVVWMIRPVVAVAGALGPVGWVAYALRRHRDREHWRREDWLGS